MSVEVEGSEPKRPLGPFELLTQNWGSVVISETIGIIKSFYFEELYFVEAKKKDTATENYAIVFAPALKHQEACRQTVQSGGVLM